MSTEANFPDEYKVGGGLLHNSPFYIRRQADDELYKNLSNGEFCYVLNSRQTGKTSLIIQTISHLQADDIKCVYIYLPKCGSKNATPEQWYLAFANELVKKLNLTQEVNVVERWNEYNFLPSYQERLVQFIEENILEKISSPIVIFIDEIDNILNRNFSLDEIHTFFECINTFCNRANKNSDKNQITFALFGVATLDDFIHNNDQIKNIFNRGKAINLKGFGTLEVRYLEKGLEGKVANTKKAIREVLNWTKGQPFLTNKICKLIQDLPSPIPQGQEKQEIAKLVESEIIENWQKEAEEDDEQQHLTTIRNQILVRGKGSSRLLELYQQILQKGEIDVDNSKEQAELRISGLVIQEEGKLKVNNKIYEAVFDLNWVEQEINNLRPYDLSLEAWLKSNRQNPYYLLSASKLLESFIWIFYKKHYENFSNEEWEFIDCSIKYNDRKKQDIATEEQRKIEEQRKEIEDLENKLESEVSKANKKKKNAKFTIPIPIGLLPKLGIQSEYIRISESFLNKSITILISGLIGFLIHKYFFKQSNLVSQSNSPQLETTENISMGGNLLFLGRDNYMYQGMQHFRDGRYKEAEPYFEKAVEKAPNDPEALIYLNNTKALRKNSGYFFPVAVTIPIKNNPKYAQEVLRGIASAQEKINENRHSNLLIIRIFDDKDKPENVAEQVVNNNNTDAKEIDTIEGVIAYSVNDKALKIYEEAKLAVISPIPHDSKLHSMSERKVFFQTSFPNRKMAQKLAEYIIDKLLLKKAIIFYDHTNESAMELKNEFKSQFEHRGGEIFEEQKLNDFQADIEGEKVYHKVKECYDKQVKVIVLFPSFKTNKITLSIAEYNQRLANNELNKDNNLQLVGSSEMYNTETLKDGSVFLDLLLVVPWAWDDDHPFSRTLEEKWQGKISWRTATSYDATRAFVKSLNKLELEYQQTEITPENILKSLTSIELSPMDTSGSNLKFRGIGERDGEPRLVTVAPKAPDVPAPEGAEFGFKLLE